MWIGLQFAVGLTSIARTQVVIASSRACISGVLACADEASRDMVMHSQLTGQAWGYATKRGDITTDLTIEQLEGECAR
jgi:hypothetical protein